MAWHPSIGVNLRYTAINRILAVLLKNFRSTTNKESSELSTCGFDLRFARAFEGVLPACIMGYGLHIEASRKKNQQEIKQSRTKYLRMTKLKIWEGVLCSSNLFQMSETQCEQARLC